LAAGTRRLLQEKMRMGLAKKSFEPMAACPLHGIRVIDLSRLVAGNAVTSQLADFGAEVLKIEDPVKGDPLRAWQTDGVSVHWKLYARNKKSVALNLRDKRAADVLRDLIASSEVLVENFRPGTLEKMGLAPAELHERNPRLIIVRVSGWGQDGPYRDRPGFGTLVESVSGYASRTGFGDREPVLPPTALADMVAGLYGAFAVMVALRQVEVDGGKGQVIDLPLLDPLFSFIATEAPIFNLTGQIRPRTGSRSETTSPRNVFRTKDGRYIGISASIQAMSERLFRAIGREDMITDPRFRNNTERLKHVEETEAPIVAFIAARTLDENMTAFAAAEVTAAPVYDIDQFLADPHVQQREIVVDVPDAQLGSVTMHNIIPRLSDTPGHLRIPAPEIGEHTAEILSQFGINHATLEAWAKDGAIRLGA
jgi:crotonobetainyl-CoA:carnitine CoA-transferase CaiB-like acyl-CoA transferase